MNLRRRFLLAASVWTAVVAAALAGLPQIWRHRLPDPMASHWGPSGAPDDAAAIGVITAVPLVLWVLLAGYLLLAIRGKGLARRAIRGSIGATFAGAAVFLIGLEGLTIWANLDRGGWRDAAHVGPAAALLVIAAAVVAAAGGWLLARMGPDESPAPAAAVPSYPLRPGERAVWVSSLTVSWAVGLATAFLVAAVVLATLALFGPWRMWMSAVLGAVGLACLTISTIRAQVDDRGLAVAFGPLRWPTRTIPLRRIERAWVEQRQPSGVGGWGYRGLPGAATIMLRGGDCLVMRTTSGGELGVSIDDAERGAALLNTLVAKHAERTGLG